MRHALLCKHDLELQKYGSYGIPMITQLEFTALEVWVFSVDIYKNWQLCADSKGKFYSASALFS